MKRTTGPLRRACVAIAILLAPPLAPSAVAQQGPQSAMNPARTASLSAASRRIEDHFVAEVARITGTTPARVRRAMPDERRITSAASRLISALELDLGAPLTPEQRAEILEADQARKLSLMKAREAAGAR